MPAGTDPKVLVMLRAYFDASYTQPHKTLVVITGCLAQASQWSSFEPLWQEMLDGEGLPYFHMADFESYKEDYKEWDAKRHKSVLKKVIEMIIGTVEFAVSRAIVVEDFEWAQSRNSHLQGHNAFSFCVIQCLQEIAAWTDQFKIVEPIGYVFESGDREGPEIENIRKRISSSKYFRRRFRWNGLSVVNKLEPDVEFPIIPLQVADVLAFEHRKEIENFYLHGTEDYPRRWPLNVLLEGIEKTSFGRFTRNELLDVEVHEEISH
ncbi:MAG: hypothetical protein H0X47_16385 [Nitrospirales bacterium]|nr:hypothetical protein [Nitrospirales bacterium]